MESKKIELTPETTVKLDGWNCSRGGQPCPVAGRYTKLKYLKPALHQFVETCSTDGWYIETVEVRTAVEDNKPKIKIGETVYEDMYFGKEYAYAEAFLVDSVPNNQQILFDLL